MRGSGALWIWLRSGGVRSIRYASTEDPWRVLGRPWKFLGVLGGPWGRLVDPEMALRIQFGCKFYINAAWIETELPSAAGGWFLCCFGCVSVLALFRPLC